MRFPALPTALLCSTIFWGQARAQETLPLRPDPIGGITNDDPQLQALEDEYAQELIDIRLELGASYMTALKRLQDDLTKRQRIEQALLVKLERERISELLQSSPELQLPTAGARPLAKLRLSPSEASCSGGTLYDEKRERLRNWTAAGSSALWQLDADMPPGRYEIIVEYAAGSDAGGDFEVSVGGTAALRGSVVTNAASTWRNLNHLLAGTVALDADSQSISMTCVSLRQPYLWTVHSLTLAPPGTYEQMERIRIEEALDGTGTKPPRSPSPRGTLETLRGVSFEAATTGARGDRFTIAHDGKRLPIRLYGVECPPPDPADKAGLAAFRKFAPNDVKAGGLQITAIGKQAAAFVRQRLASGVFNVYTYREADRSDKGRVLAYVAVDGATLGEALVARGLAQPSGRPAPLPDGTTGADYITKLNAAAENAQSRKLGLWGLRDSEPLR